jgi:outer membrane receptor protein involved in Fe transport
MKGGVNIFYHTNNNEHTLLIDHDNLPPQDELTNVYPIIGMEFNLGPMGSLFGTFEPILENVSLINTLDLNPYLNMSAPLSYQDIVSNLKVGWRRSGTYDLSFETYYNYRDVNNYGIITPQSTSTADEDSGHWDIVYNNDIKFHEIRAMLNWRFSEFIAIWSSAGYQFYEIEKSDFADQIPYFPRLDFDFVFRALPGYGIEFMLNGQFLSDQFTLSYENENTDDNKIASHFIANLSISKKISDHFELYAQVNNLLNTDYEIWKDYFAPKINGWGGIKIFW